MKCNKIDSFHHRVIGITNRSGSAAPMSLLLLMVLSLPLHIHGDIPLISGGGNFTNGDTSTPRMRALNIIGARALRLNLYPNDYWNTSIQDSRPQRIDDQMRLLHQHGLNPIVILFEYYSNYSVTNDAPRDSSTWFLIGKGFAGRWRPNSEYLMSQGIYDWGIRVYQAINEPDANAQLPKSEYTSMLKGLAAGVHSVDTSLAVIPGGFMSENAFSDHTLRGYGTAIAPLLNDGTLNGIDFHTYNDTRYAPIEKTETNEWFWRFSPQSDFDEVKAACGITRDINFYASEYGFKNNEQGITPEYCAKRTLTCIWGNLAVTRQNGKTSATKFALIWQFYALDTIDKTYGLARKIDPAWEGNSAGKTFQMVMRLTEGMEFTAINEPVKGMFLLEGNGKKMWVWQNLPEWTQTPGTTFTVTGIPSGSKSLSVYCWNSWEAPKRTIALSGQDKIIVNELVPGETYMFLLDGSGQTSVAHHGYSIAQKPHFYSKLKLQICANAQRSTELDFQHAFDLRGRKLQQNAPRQLGTAGVWLLFLKSRLRLENQDD